MWPGGARLPARHPVLRPLSPRRDSAGRGAGRAARCCGVAARLEGRARREYRRAGARGERRCGAVWPRLEGVTGTCGPGGAARPFVNCQWHGGGFGSRV